MWGKRQCELRDLRRATKVVTCPGCAQSKTTIRIRQRYDSVTIFWLTWFSIVFLGIPWLFARKKLGGEFLVHYCGHCGLRLLVYTTFLRRFFVDDDQLTGEPQGQDILRHTTITQSPFPPDTELVRETDYSRWQERYIREQPAKIFIIENESDMYKVTGLWDADHANMLYSVTYPDLDYSFDGKFGANLLWKHKRDDSALPAPVYAASNASLCVSSTSLSSNSDVQRHTTMVQIAQLKWDVRFYFSGQEQDDGHRTRYMHTKADKLTFDIWQPYFRWESCQGELLWMRRPAIDAKSAANAESKPQKWDVLLDRYDRLVAMVCWKISKLTFKEVYDDEMRRRRGDQPRAKEPSYPELRLYGDFSEELVLEILTSYVVLKVQQKRAYDFDTIKNRAL